MKHYLLTRSGRVLGLSLDGSFIKLPLLRYVVDSYLAVEIAETAAPGSFQALVTARQTRDVLLDLPAFGSFMLHVDMQHGTARISREGEFLTAEGSDGSWHFTPGPHEGEDEFVLVSAEAMTALFEVLENDWIIQSSRRRVARHDMAVCPGPALRLGGLSLPLPQNLPQGADVTPFRRAIFRDGWKHDQILRYDPLMYFVAYGQQAIDQLKICLNSLFEIGRYDGKVLIFTDQTEAEIRAGVFDMPVGRLFVRNPPLSDWVGYVAGKYMILEEEVAQRCAPVVYMDPDIVFNTNVRPIIAEMLCLGKIAAPPEYFSKLNDNPGVGADLFRADGVETGDAWGFNAGTIIVPNLGEFGHVLQLIRQTLQNFLLLNGRDSLRWVDQESANYISHRYSPFDMQSLSSRVRWGRWEKSQVLGDLTGLVHFWPIRDISQRIIGMAHYLDLLRAHQKVI